MTWQQLQGQESNAHHAGCLIKLMVLAAVVPCVFHWLLGQLATIQPLHTGTWFWIRIRAPTVRRSVDRRIAPSVSTRTWMETLVLIAVHANRKSMVLLIVMHVPLACELLLMIWPIYLISNECSIESIIKFSQLNPCSWYRIYLIDCWQNSLEDKIDKVNQSYLMRHQSLINCFQGCICDMSSHN